MGDKRKLLIVVDMQNDFIDGSLGSQEAVEAVPRVVDKILHWDGNIVFTKDCHKEEYLSTHEGKYLPVRHCISGTHGEALNEYVTEAMPIYADVIKKNSFGTFKLVEKVKAVKEMNGKQIVVPRYDYVELIGVCSDICVISNALLLRNAFPELTIAVDKACCAGSSPEAHEAAFAVMKNCHIDILNEDFGAEPTPTVNEKLDALLMVNEQLLEIAEASTPKKKNFLDNLETPIKY